MSWLRITESINHDQPDIDKLIINTKHIVSMRSYIKLGGDTSHPLKVRYYIIQTVDGTVYDNIIEIEELDSLPYSET